MTNANMQQDILDVLEAYFMNHEEGSSLLNEEIAEFREQNDVSEFPTWAVHVAVDDEPVAEPMTELEQQCADIYQEHFENFYEGCEDLQDELEAISDASSVRWLISVKFRSYERPI